jgi:hypothetical protein
MNNDYLECTLENLLEKDSFLFPDERQSIDIKNFLLKRIFQLFLTQKSKEKKTIK